jgi:RimJ/RimL family protein N-acetyltransferase
MRGYRVSGDFVRDLKNVGMADVKLLVGERVTLRAPQLEDAEALFRAGASDAEVPHYMTWTPHPDVDETRRVITELFNVGDERVWLIELRESGEVLGVCGCRPDGPHGVDFGYWLGPRWWGQGLMSEAVQLLLAEITADPAVYRISATCHVDNKRSARVLERAGLVLEGQLDRHMVFPNISTEPQDVLQFAKVVR